MIGADLKPWLIEINCSPTMARATAVTTLLCDAVLEDVCKGTISYILQKKKRVLTIWCTIGGNKNRNYLKFKDTQTQRIKII